MVWQILNPAQVHPGFINFRAYSLGKYWERGGELVPDPETVLDPDLVLDLDPNPVLCSPGVNFKPKYDLSGSLAAMAANVPSGHGPGPRHSTRPAKAEAGPSK